MAIDPGSDRAVFRQLADLLRELILSGELVPGAPLPSELRLTQEHGVSRTTVRQAVAILRAEGLVEVARPHGTYVRPRPERTIVPIEAGTVTARMPTPDERRRLDVGEGIPLLQIECEGQIVLHAADRTALRVEPAPAS